MSNHATGLLVVAVAAGFTVLSSLTLTLTAGARVRQPLTRGVAPTAVSSSSTTSRTAPAPVAPGGWTSARPAPTRSRWAPPSSAAGSAADPRHPGVQCIPPAGAYEVNGPGRPSVTCVNALFVAI